MLETPQSASRSKDRPSTQPPPPPAAAAAASYHQNGLEG